MKSIAWIKRCIKRKNHCVPSLLLWEREWSRIGFQSCYYWSRWAIIYFCPTASSSAHYARGSRLLGHSRRPSPSWPLTLTSSFRPSSQMKGRRLLVPSLFFTPPNSLPNDSCKGLILSVAKGHTEAICHRLRHRNERQCVGLFGTFTFWHSLHGTVPRWSMRPEVNLFLKQFTRINGVWINPSRYHK